MKSSSDDVVIDFLLEYKDVLEEMAGSSDGEVLGFINPILRDDTKTPFPCAVSWSNAQRYEITDDVQQCVKKRILEYNQFFTF